MRKIHKTIIISGIVQGVGFRYSCMHMANAMGIKGSVCNLPDGSVKIEAEAPEKQIELFIKWCYQGPTHARVTNVQISDGTVKNYRYFDITH